MLVSIYFNLLMLLLTPVFGVFIVQLCVLFNFCFCCIVHSCSRQNTPATAGSRSLLNFNIFVFLFCCICGYSDEPSHRAAVPPPSTFSVETALNTFDCDVIPEFGCSLKPDYFSKLVDSKTSVRINSD